jgi:hypothetical protein
MAVQYKMPHSCLFDFSSLLTYYTSLIHVSVILPLESRPELSQFCLHVFMGAKNKKPSQLHVDFFSFH